LFQTRACCLTLENDAKRENKGMMSGDIRQMGLARQGPEKRYQQQEKLIGEQEQAFMDRLSSSPGVNASFTCRIVEVATKCANGRDCKK
jgi:hypothetical protein